MSQDTHCLFSTVRNNTAGRILFGFLPPHGRELAAGEEFTIFGNVVDMIATRRGDRVSSRRDIQAFEAAISRGDLVIVHTPAPIFQDQTTHAIKMLRLNSGSLGVVDPCWANPGSVVEEGFE